MTATELAPVHVTQMASGPHLSPRRLAVRRFLRHRVAVASAVVLVLLALAVVLLPIVLGTEPNTVDPSATNRPPGAEHWLGTDAAGRDVFARLLVGGQVSLLVGLTVAVFATVIGLLLGLLAGFVGGRVDAVLSRLTDTVLAFPTMVVVIVLAGFLGPSLVTLILALAVLEWTTAYRIVRGLTLSLRERDAIEAVQGLGASPARVLRRHVLPDVVGSLTVVGTLLVAQSILLETTLSFLGLGVPPPMSSWGNMLNSAQSLTILETMPWLWLPPGLAISITVLAVNFLGDGLRDAVDPRSTR